MVQRQYKVLLKGKDEHKDKLDIWTSAKMGITIHVALVILIPWLLLQSRTMVQYVNLISGKKQQVNKL